MRWDRLRFASLLVVLAVVLHAHELLLPLGDEAVGLYLHVAAVWNRGGLPYVAAWEYKPPGLYALLALALRVAPPAIAVQTLAIAATVATALAIAGLVDETAGVRCSRIGRFAALLYLTLSIEDEGFIGDADVLLVPFVAWAIVLGVRRIGWREALGIGLLCACALQMKLSALPLLVVPAALVLLRSGGVATLARNAVAALGGFLAPVALEVAAYAHAHELGALVDANVGATMRRASGLRHGVLAQNVPKFWAQARILAPAIELAPFAAGTATTALVAGVGWAWFVAAIVTVLGIGEFYDRHFSVLAAPLAVLGTLGFAFVCRRFSLGTNLRRGLGIALLVLSFGMHDYYQTVLGIRLAVQIATHHRPTTRIEQLTDLAAAEGSCSKDIWVVEESPWLYDRLGASAPTRYVDSDHLLERAMIGMVGIDTQAELRRILEVERPKVLLVGSLTPARLDPAAVALVRAHLARDYRALDHLTDFTLYVRNGARCGTQS